jgi:hypothetical protein
MRTNNKMKDYEVEFEEWWEVVKEYYTKELEKNLAHHKTNERIMKYKLEIYQKNFLDFVYGNLASIEASDKDEEVKAGPNGIV